MTYDEALNVTGSTASTTNDLRYIGASGTTNRNAYYWLATAYDSYTLYRVDGSGTSYSYSNNYSFGIRPVIVLKDGIKTPGKGTDLVGQEAWLLSKP